METALSLTGIKTLIPSQYFIRPEDSNLLVTSAHSVLTSCKRLAILESDALTN